MKILQILFIFLLLCGLSSIIKAQVDCGFDFRLYVRDSKGFKINDARIKMNLADFYYNGQTNSYNAWTLLGVGSNYKASLKIEAKGFEKFERLIDVRCGHFSFELSLKSKGTNEKAIYEELAIIKGIVKDSNGGVISSTKVTLKDEKGNRIETITNENGYFDLTVQSGKYSLDFIGTAGFAPKSVENFELKKGYQNFDVVLEVKSCDDPTMNCHTITSDPTKNN
ncbi:hypothetical protein BH20ACI4_BH20ACI4_31600 [soil metagenome]